MPLDTVAVVFPLGKRRHIADADAERTYCGTFFSRGFDEVEPSRPRRSPTCLYCLRTLNRRKGKA